MQFMYTQIHMHIYVYILERVLLKNTTKDNQVKFYCLIGCKIKNQFFTFFYDSYGVHCALWSMAKIEEGAGEGVEWGQWPQRPFDFKCAYTKM